MYIFPIAQKADPLYIRIMTFVVSKYIFSVYIIVFQRCYVKNIDCICECSHYLLILHILNYICVYNILSSLSFLECYKCPKLNIRLHILYVLDGFLFAIFCVL